MKTFICAIALMGCLVACNTEKRAVTDASAPNAPKAECCEGMKASSCSDAAKAECSGAKAKSCCQEAKPQE